MSLSPALTFLLILVPLTTGQTDVDTSKNLTFELNFQPGACPELLSPYLFSCNSTLYDGQWYLKYIVLKATNNASFSCLTSKLTPEESGSYHNFMSGVVNGEYKTLNLKVVPVPGRPGIFQSYTATIPQGISSMATYYYTDGEMMVIRELICLDDGSKHIQNAVVAFRNVEWVRREEPQLRKVLKMLEASVGQLKFHSVRHDDKCKYPEGNK